jgi:nucleotide-binding universal stress UspA family protein
MHATTQRIVVGVDGSEPAEQALEWAAREAQLRDATLEVVTAWATPMAYSGVGVPAVAFDPSLRDSVAAHAEETADHAARRAVALGAQAIPRTVEGHASNVLLEMSDGANLLVVGSRGRGGFGSLLLGSVSAQCAHHAACPVAIIR